jgi:hypothetical protein
MLMGEPQNTKKLMKYEPQCLVSRDVYDYI